MSFNLLSFGPVSSRDEELTHDCIRIELLQNGKYIFYTWTRVSSVDKPVEEKRPMRNETKIHFSIPTQ